MVFLDAPPLLVLHGAFQLWNLTSTPFFRALAPIEVVVLELHHCATLGAVLLDSERFHMDTAAKRASAHALQRSSVPRYRCAIGVPSPTRRSGRAPQCQSMQTTYTRLCIANGRIASTRLQTRKTGQHDRRCDSSQMRPRKGPALSAPTRRSEPMATVQVTSVTRRNLGG